MNDSDRLIANNNDILFMMKISAKMRMIKVNFFYSSIQLTYLDQKRNENMAKSNMDKQEKSRNK
uniref:Uncharacterized protein n=1 Tax=Onchocerca volvulus TaxID=6282 RepID=A0A8R1XXF1_ONCVO